MNQIEVLTIGIHDFPIKPIVYQYFSLIDSIPCHLSNHFIRFPLNDAFNEIE